jgi:glycine/sarcosine N-methyltransferase
MGETARMAEPRDFYDSLAGDYHLMFADWWTSAVAQGEALDRFLRSRGVSPGATLLDCTCGIGTQALPLAARGYRVTGSDLSASAVARARDEAARRGIPITLGTADVRALTSADPFDVVISADNSLPHLRTEEDLGAALRAIRGVLAPDGVFLASVRDYDALARDRVAGVMPVTHTEGGTRRIVGQSWTWTDDRRTVTFDLFMLRQQEDGWNATVRTTTYRAWRRAELTAAMTSAGFTDIVWADPPDSGYYQPVVTARIMRRDP